ncbi:MAG: flavin reductase family protein [Treponema sp.]|nr:flavin reductase family protein [Treponema sp.]
MIQKSVISADVNWAEKSLREFKGSPVQRIGEEWMLITAGSTAAGAGNWNTMTASWGGFGVLWDKDVAFIFIRPSRHTRAFVEANSLFTLSFFDKKYHKALALCGERSGRDHDKASETGLTPIVFENNVAGGRAAGAVAFREASDIVICRKIYSQDIDPSKFLDTAIGKNYPKQDYHRMYAGEVLALLSAK